MGREEVGKCCLNQSNAGKKSENGLQWNEAKTYNKALPALSTIGAVYGGLVPFGLPSGMPKHIN